MIASVVGFLDTLGSGIDISFQNYDQFEEVVLDVFEAVEGKLEYVIDYNPDEFFSVSISEVFEV